jgi:hypothetical protein
VLGKSPVLFPESANWASVKFEVIKKQKNKKQKTQINQISSYFASLINAKFKVMCFVDVVIRP